MLVLAGNEAGLQAFEKTVPELDGRFPMRLTNHAAFHTTLQIPVSELGVRQLSDVQFRQPDLPIIDGRGAVSYPRASDLSDLFRYTLGHQVTEAFDFSAALRTAARELMPDAFIVLGPGTTLGGASAQALIRCRWRSWREKADVQPREIAERRLLSMGDPAMRAMCTGG